MRDVILTDTESGVWHDEYRLDVTDGPRLAGADNWSIEKRTLRGGRSHGVDVVSLNNGLLSVDVLPTRGMGLWRGTCQGIRIGWNSPVRWPVHPSLVNLTASDGLGWLAGFNEWVCRCGLASLGPPGVDVREARGISPAESTLTLHGAIANTPAHHVAIRVDEQGDGALELNGVVDEAAMFGPNLRLESQLRMEAGSTLLTIVDRVTNLGDEPAEVQLMYHANFGPPLLGAGARVVTAASEIIGIDDHATESIDRWDTYPEPTPGITQDVFLIRPLPDAQGRAIVMLRDTNGESGTSITFPVTELPCLAVWKHPAGIRDGYVTGLEPSTSYPNFKTFERQRGRVIELPPGETYRASIEIAIHTDRATVAAEEERIGQIQRARTPILHRQPHPDFNPHALPNV